MQQRQSSFLQSEQLLLEAIASLAAEGTEGLGRQAAAEEPLVREARFHLSLLYSHTNRSTEALAQAQLALRACAAPALLCADLHAHLADVHNERGQRGAAQQVRAADA